MRVPAPLRLEEPRRGRGGLGADGDDEILKEEGIEYFFTDSHMIRGGQPLGTYAAKFPQLAEMFARLAQYFTPPEEFRTEYEHYFLSGVTTMARDPETTVKVWSGDAGYPGDEHYLEFHKQLYPGRLKYWRITPNKSDLGQKQPYDPWAAFEKIGSHALDLVQTLKGVLAQYKGSPTGGHAGRDVRHRALWPLVVGGAGIPVRARAGPARRWQHRDGQWRRPDRRGSGAAPHHPARRIVGRRGLPLHLDQRGQRLDLEAAVSRRAEAAADGREYAGAPQEVVEQAAREVLLAESSDWQFLISTFAARDYAEVRFTDHLDRFERLAAIADRVHTGGAMTADERLFLKDCEERMRLSPSLRSNIGNPNL